MYRKCMATIHNHPYSNATCWVGLHGQKITRTVVTHDFDATKLCSKKLNLTSRIQGVSTKKCFSWMNGHVK